MSLLNRLPKPDPEKENQRIHEIAQEDLSWKDKLAMVLSAYAVIGIPAIVMLLLVLFVAMWMFGIL